MNGKMTFEIAETQPALKRPGRRRGRGVVLGIVIVMLGAAAWLAYHKSTPPTPGVQWLTSAEFNQVNRAGPLTMMKWRLMRLLGPFGNVFRSKTNIKIDVRVMGAPSGTRGYEPGEPAASRKDAVLAWILAADQMKSPQSSLGFAPASDSSCRILTGDGTQATLYQGAMVSVHGTNVPLGLSVSVLPKTAEEGVSLLLSTSLLELAQQTNGGGQIETNFALACRAFIPDDRILLLATEEPKRHKVFYLAVSVAAMDAAGKPIKR